MRVSPRTSLATTAARLNITSLKLCWFGQVLNSRSLAAACPPAWAPLTPLCRASTPSTSPGTSPPAPRSSSRNSAGRFESPTSMVVYVGLAGGGCALAAAFTSGITVPSASATRREESETSRNTSGSMDSTGKVTAALHVLLM